MRDSQPELYSKRLVLEPLRESHSGPLYESLLDVDLYRFLPQDPPVSEQTVRDRYLRLEARQSPDGSEVWLNWAMRSPEVAGYVGTLEATVGPDRTAYVAYMVFARHQRMGFATEGLRRILRYLVAVYAVQTIAALIDTRNRASIALVQRLGFVPVARINDADFFKGTPSDEYRYELSGKTLFASLL
ncbi:MAG: GNAT family N-acetyltransferase [Chloroflexota bacterium]